MKLFSRYTLWLSLALCLAGVCSRADAQIFGYFATPSQSSLFVSNSLTYTIGLTNIYFTGLASVTVTSALPASVQIQRANATQGFFVTNGNAVIFSLGSMSLGGRALMTVTAVPTAVGSIANVITFAANAIPGTVTTNVIVNVTNTVPEVDLGVAITPPAQAVITNDFATYGVIVTNAGPGAAPDVILTNILPAGVLLKQVSPTNQAFMTFGTNLVFNLGKLTNAGSATLEFTIEPTNVGTLTLSAFVNSTNADDINLTNNFATTNIDVIGYLPGTLVVVTNSAQHINLQNGLTEQTILLSNTGTNDVPAARIIVSGLTNHLFNAVGTNSGNPFVYYSAPLPVGQNATLRLQFSPRSFFPFTNGQLQAFPVPLPNWTPPAAGVGTNFSAATNILLPNGDVLVEFPATLGRSYTIIYADNALMSNAMVAPPNVIAPADRVQWIDYGPPTTVSPPMSVGSRFYRVLLNQ